MSCRLTSPDDDHMRHNAANREDRYRRIKIDGAP
jgi:hypothetical protein